MERQQWLRERLGYLPQDFGFYGHLSGRDMLVHLLRLKGVSAPGGMKALADELLERVNLTFAAKRAVKSYSGGMRQRLGIAQAIAGNPRLLIVDEPTAGLDPEERLRFYHLLAQLAEERIVLLSTHIVEDVAVLCPQFAVIRARPARRAHHAARGARGDGRAASSRASCSPSELPDLRAQLPRSRRSCSSRAATACACTRPTATSRGGFGRSRRRSRTPTSC